MTCPLSCMIQSPLTSLAVNGIWNYQHPPLSHNGMLHFLHSIVCYLTKCCRSSAVSLRLIASGPQPPPCLSNTYIFIQNWPCTGARHQSALCLQPLRCCASPLCYVPLWVGPGYWIVCGFVLARNLSSFFFFFFSSLLQNHGPFILTQLLLKPGWAEW